MHFKAENLTIPKHPQLLFLAQNLGVLRPSKTWSHFFWDTLYSLNFKMTFYFIFVQRISLHRWIRLNILLRVFQVSNHSCLFKDAFLFRDIEFYSIQTVYLDN